MKNLTPSRLRIGLSVALLLLIAVGVGLFMFGYGKINEFAATAQTTAAEATASNSSLQDLATTKKVLETNSASVDRAAKLAAESQQYVYQDQIITDINQFGSEAGMTITNITFAEATTAPVVAAPAAATTSATTDAAAAPATVAAPGGVKSVTATVGFKNPVGYSNILTFVHLIEQSLFRMQISQLSLSRATGDDADKVTSDTLTIEVYVR